MRVLYSERRVRLGSKFLILYKIPIPLAVCEDMLLNPKRAGGRYPPPSTFRAIISQNFFFRAASFHDFFSSSLAPTFDAIFGKNRAYGSKVTQHYVIERRLKIRKFSEFCVQNIWKMASCAKTPF